MTVEFTVDKGSYKAEAGEYADVTVTVKDDAAATRVVTATVVAGNNPVLTVPSFTEINVGDMFSLTTGVTVSDTEDTLAVSDVIMSPATIDTSVAGVANIKYTVTDSDGNKVEATQTVLVNDGSFTAGDTYIIKATDFENRISQVDTTDAGILKDAQVKVFDKQTGAEVTVEFTVSKGSYKATVGEYTDVTVTVKNDTAATRIVSATVITGGLPTVTVPNFTEVKVGESFDILSGVSVSDAEDSLTLADVAMSTSTIDTSVAGVVSITYTVTDSDGNKAEATQTVLVNDGSFTAGDTYIITATVFDNRVALVDTADAGILKDAQVKVFDKQTGAEVTVEFTVSKGSYKATVGEYTDVT
ncbi:MAG: immunoglobulin-like domain-containing protein, partial [Anaerorhabdus sp.]